MPADFSQDHVRLSDADRQQAISHLEDCTKDGRLDLDEFTQRVEQITGAKTYGELRPIFADLPNLPVAYNARPAPDRSPMPASDDVQVLRPMMSSDSRSGEWVAPRSMVLRPVFSSIELNFAKASIPHRRVDIEVDAMFSSISIVLPSESWAEDDVALRFSSIENKARVSSKGGETCINIFGKITLSSIHIRHAYFSKWRRKYQ